MKDVIRCEDCAYRLYDLGVGFTAVTTMLCGMIGREVDPDDGCTFGIVGDGGYVVREIDVSIEGREAVNGDHYYYEY